MGVGPNYVLDKGFRATGATAYARGELTVPTNTGLDVVRAGPGAVTNFYLVNMEDLDVTRLATGKAILDQRMLGIARVVCGAAVTIWSRIVSDAAAKGIVSARTAAAGQPIVVAGIALTATTAAGQEFDMLLTPGMTW